MTWEAFGGTAIGGLGIILFFGPGGKWDTILCGIWIAACLAFGITAMLTHAIPTVMSPLPAEVLPH